jgi:tight adherence protein B
MNAWMPALLVFVAVAFATIALALVVEAARTWARRRGVARHLDRLMASPEAGLGGDRPELFRREEEAASVLDIIIARSRRLRGLPVLLEHSGVGWSTGTLALLTVGGAAAAGLFGLVVRGGYVVPLVLAALGAWAPLGYVKFKKHRRFARFEEVFPEAVDMLARAIRAGHPLSAGIQMVGHEMAEPVAAEFRTIFEEQRFGVHFADALMGMVDRIDLVDVRIFVTAVLVQREVGGNLSEILDNISSTIRGRFKIRRQLRTYTAQGRMSGIVVGAMPLVVGLVFFAINPQYIQLLFDHPVGRVMLAMGITLQIFGYLWIRKIVNIEI